MDMTIKGLGIAQVQYTEYQSQDVLNAYSQYMTNIKNYLDLIPTLTNSPNLTTVYDNLIGTLSQLSSLVQNGLTENPGTANQYQSFVTNDMAQNISNVMNGLAAAGIPPSQPLSSSPQDQNTKIELLNNWSSLAGFGIEDSLKNAIALVVNTQQVTSTDPVTGVTTVGTVPITSTLQSMLELNYVKEGNDLISGKLGSLSSALNITTGVITTLTALQNLANHIQVTIAQTPPASVTNPDVGNTSDSNVQVANYKGNYETAASAYFSQVYPSAIPTNTDPTTLYGLKLALSAQVASLLKQNSDASANIQSVSSLAARLYTVMKDISAQFSAITVTGTGGLTGLALYNSNKTLFASAYKSAASNWILDGDVKGMSTSSVTNNPGPIMQNLTYAIQQAENVNNSQSDTVRQYTQIFQEFYQTASAMLQDLLDTIQKIDQGIKKK